MGKINGGDILKTDLEISQLINPLDIKRISLEYLLTQNRNESKLDSYGIEVIKTTIRNNNKETEKLRVDNISCSKEKARNILKILVQNNVTPISLKDVIEDLIV